MSSNWLLLAIAVALALLVHAYVKEAYGRNIKVALVLVTFTAATAYLDSKIRRPLLRLLFLAGLALTFVAAMTLAAGKL